MSSKARLFWPVVLTLLCTDCATKRAAVEHLSPAHVPHALVGDVVRLTLAYNRGAAMSLPVGGGARPLLILATLGVLLVLASFYRRAAANDRVLVAATALLVGGALGNLVDRVRWSGGVIDFIDVGLGAHRFWIFNVADVGVTIGATMLALALMRHDARGAAPGPPDLSTGAGA